MLNLAESQEEFARQVINNVLAPFGFSKVTPEPGQYSDFDFRGLKNGKESKIEFKQRTYTSNHFDSWFIRKSKVERIGPPFIYVNLYKDDVARLWVVTEDLLSNTNSGKITIPNQTTPGPNRHMHRREVYFLDPSDAYTYAPELP